MIKDLYKLKNKQQAAVRILSATQYLLHFRDISNSRLFLQELVTPQLHPTKFFYGVNCFSGTKQEKTSKEIIFGYYPSHSLFEYRILYTQQKDYKLKEKKKNKN